jgi:hypothetical protein
MSEIVSVAYWTELVTPPQQRSSKTLRDLFGALAESCAYANYRTLQPSGAVMAGSDGGEGDDAESTFTVTPDRLQVKEQRAEGVSIDEFQDRVTHAVRGSTDALAIPFFLHQRACLQAVLHQHRHKLAMEYVARDVAHVDPSQLAGHLGTIGMLGLRCFVHPAGNGQGAVATPAYDVQIESSVQDPAYLWISVTGNFPGPLAGVEPGGVIGNVRAVYEFAESRVVPFVLGNTPPADQ